MEFHIPRKISAFIVIILGIAICIVSLVSDVLVKERIAFLSLGLVVILIGVILRLKSLNILYKSMSIPSKFWAVYFMVIGFVMTFHFIFPSKNINSFLEHCFQSIIGIGCFLGGYGLMKRTHENRRENEE